MQKTIFWRILLAGAIFFALLPGPAAPAAAQTKLASPANIVINTGQTLTGFTALQRGSNTPAWLADRYSNATFKARTKVSGVGAVRIPGGSWSNMYGWLSCENRVYKQGKAYQCGGEGEDWSSWITRPTDFINFLKATGKSGMYVVNVNATAQESAAIVAFFNAKTTDTTLIGVDRNGQDWKTAGHWARLRAAHGNPEPFYIKYWEFGNEVYGGKPSTGGSQCQPWGWEESWTCDGSAYINGNAGHDGYKAVRAAMKAVDPSILVGVSGLEYPADYNNWGNELVQAAGKYMDFYAIHPYAYWDLPPNTAAGWAQALAKPRQIWPANKARIRNAFKTYAGGRIVPILATEYNLVGSHDQDFDRMMTRAGNMLFIAESIGQAARNGYRSANQWDLSNGCAPTTGSCYDLLLADKNFARSPQYFAFVLWGRFGNKMLASTSSAATSVLSVYAGRTISGQFSLLAINKTGNPVSANIRLKNGSLIKSALVDVAQSTSLISTVITFNGKTTFKNDLSDAPPKKVTVNKVTMSYTFAPYSVTLLRLRP